MSQKMIQCTEFDILLKYLTIDEQADFIYTIVSDDNQGTLTVQFDYMVDLNGEKQFLFDEEDQELFGKEGDTLNNNIDITDDEFLKSL